MLEYCLLLKNPVFQKSKLFSFKQLGLNKNVKANITNNCKYNWIVL